jgi:hypothetical protein
VIKFAIGSTPSPLFKFQNTKGRFPRILSASASITLRFAPTRGEVDRIDNEQVGARNPRAADPGHQDVSPKTYGYFLLDRGAARGYPHTFTLGTTPEANAQLRHNIIDLLCRPVAPFGSAGLGVTVWGVPLPS